MHTLQRLNKPGSRIQFQALLKLCSPSPQIPLVMKLASPPPFGYTWDTTPSLLQLILPTTEQLQTLRDPPTHQPTVIHNSGFHVQCCHKPQTTPQRHTNSPPSPTCIAYNQSAKGAAKAALTWKPAARKGATRAARFAEDVLQGRVGGGKRANTTPNEWGREASEARERRCNKTMGI
jgi:hypothetical protein